MSDQRALVCLAKAGDHSAFGELIRNNRQMVLKTIGARIRCQDAIEEIAQVVAITAWNKLQSLREDGRFSHWLSVIAQRAAYYHYRQVKRNSRLRGQADQEVLDKLLGREPDPSRRVELEFAREQLWLCIGRLKGWESESLVRFYFNFQTCREISQDLQIPLKTMKRRLWDARRSLRERLGDNPLLAA